MTTRVNKQHGFTIVELLIVIVVISILAAITIFAYNGISSRATASALQSDLTGAAKILENDKTLSTGGTYPGGLSSANSGKGIVAASGAGYQYTVGDFPGEVNPKSYCLTIIKGNTSYYVDQNGVIKSGYCTGHIAPENNNAIVTTIAGSTQGYGDATGTAAQFYRPFGMVFDTSGDMYIADAYNNRIRKMTPAGDVTTFAGSGVAGTANGTGVAAQFSRPLHLAIDSSNNIYVSDASNRRVRKITPAGVVTTLAGSSLGYTDATGTAAQFGNLGGIAVDASGNVFVSDGTNHRIRKVTPGGVVSTFAGSGVVGNYADGTGLAAGVFAPGGLTIDQNGNLYLTENTIIRKITPSAVVTTIVGPMSSSPFDQLSGGIAVKSNGDLYVADYAAHRIKKVTQSGVVSSIAGSGVDSSVDGTGVYASMKSPQGLALDASGSLFFTDYTLDTTSHLVRKIQLP